MSLLSIYLEKRTSVYHTFFSAVGAGTTGLGG